MAFLKDVESEDLRELVKSCFKEINSLKEQLEEENKDIRSDKAVKNVLIQNENQNTNLHAKIDELNDKINKQETKLREKDLQLQEKDTKIKEKDLEIKEIKTLANTTNVNSEETQKLIDEYKEEVIQLRAKVKTQDNELNELKTANEEFKSSIKEGIDDENRELKLEIERLKEENNAFKAGSSDTQVTQLKAVIDRQTEELKQIPDLKNQLTREIGEKDQEIKKCNEEINSLKEQITQQESLDEYKEKLQDAENQLEEAKGQVSELNTNNTHLKEELDILSQKLLSTGTEDEINELSKEVADLKEENEQLNEKISQMEQENSDASFCSCQAGRRRPAHT